MARILLIDDDPVTQLFCRRILEKYGCEVDVASEGRNVMININRINYDYMLVDLVLPGKMNGIDIIKKARDLSSNTTIIAYSGFSDVDIAEKVIHAGANNFISKPFKPDELIKVMFPDRANSLTFTFGDYKNEKDTGGG